MSTRPLIKRISYSKYGLNYKLFIDNEAYLTPLKNEIILPLKLVKAIIREFNNQENQFNFEKMPFYSFCLTSIDKVAPNRKLINQEIINFFNTDLLLYNAENDKQLKSEQVKYWKPMIQLFEKNLKISVNTTQYIHQVCQNEKTLKKINYITRNFSDLEITGFYNLVKLSSSFILSYLIYYKMITFKSFLHLSSLEENFQEKKWGKTIDRLDRKKNVSAELRETLNFILCI